jgi:Cu+-exporting ATPase
MLPHEDSSIIVPQRLSNNASLAHEVLPNTAAKVGEYTCPMHPEIVRSEPGNCPICGMALELRTISAGDEKNPELADMQRRFGSASS